MKIKPQILCALTDWKDHVGTRGRASGKTMSQRMVLGADKYNWFTATEKQDSPGVLIDKAYLGSIRSVLLTLPKNEDVPKMVNHIIGALVKRTGITAQFQSNDPYVNLDTLGRWIDDTFKTSYHKDANDNTLFARLFGLNKDVEDDDEQ